MSGEALIVEKLPTYQPFSKEVTKLPNGYYTVKAPNLGGAIATDDEIKSTNWFSTPPLTQDAIDRLAGLQLFAESHDQGFVDNPLEGNWTWFELQIMEKEGAKDAKIKDSIKLAWKSHYNRFNTKDFGWSAGNFFGGEHDIFGQLQPGNVISVTLCARFKKWEIKAKDAYLVLKLGGKTVKHGVDYKPYVINIGSMQDILDEANDALDPAFIPEINKSLFVANSFRDSDKPLRVLSLDGGGVRGISSLYILKQIMQEFGEDRPCKVFDLIAGTSTGGLIAIMLGRLGMTIDQCIKEYGNLATTVFKYGVAKKYSNVAFKGTFYKGEDLETVIKKCVEDVLKEKNVKLQGMPPVEGAKSKVFVMAVREDAANNRGPVLLRSYQDNVKIPELPEIEIWQAARATSAAPVYFPPITVGKYKLVDGGLAANNPIGWVWNECMNVFGVNRPIACFLSIGTGIPKNKAVGKVKLFSQKKLADGLAGAVTNSQITHLLFRALLDAYAPTPGTTKYWRFNVNQEVPEGFTDADKDGKLITELANEKKAPKSDDYKDIGQLDEVKLMATLTEMTLKYAALAKEEISGCVAALKLDSQKGRLAGGDGSVRVEISKS